MDPRTLGIAAVAYSERIAVESSLAAADGIPIVPATLIRSDAALRRVAAELGPDAGRVFVDPRFVDGNQREAKQRTRKQLYKKGRKHWAWRSARNGRR